MTVTCPKCDYTRTERDTAPAYECPRCGVIYAKAKPRLSVQPSENNREPATKLQNSRVPDTESLDTQPLEIEMPNQTSFWDTVRSSISVLNKRQKQIGAAALVASFFLGYFIGREHIKYEISSAFQDTTAGLRNLFGGGEGNTEVPKSKTVKQSKVEPILPKLLRKGTHNREYGQSSITFALEFSNMTGKNIRAFDGIITFTDLLGNEIHGAKLAVNDPIAAGGTLEWEGMLNYNQFISSHDRLKNSELENTKVVFTVKKILFGDGEIKEF